MNSADCRSAAQLSLPFESQSDREQRLLATLRSLGLSSITSCKLTNNRTIMVSISGNSLRAHESYADAPDHVLQAIVTFFTRRRSQASRTARRTILDYSRAVRVPDANAPRRERRNRPEDLAIADKLAAAHTEMNQRLFGGSLRALRPLVSRKMRSRLGHYSPAVKQGSLGEIAISRRHIRRDGWAGALDTLLHEMVHQWQDENALPVNHGAEFRRKAREVGTAPSARSKLIFD